MEIADIVDGIKYGDDLVNIISTMKLTLMGFFSMQIDRSFISFFTFSNF